jgi:hypothetical protein
VFRQSSRLFFGALVLLGRSAVAHAEEPIAVRIALDAPSGCSTSADLYQALRKRTDRVRLAVDGERAFDVRVKLEPVGQNVHGELSVVSDRGETDTRTVEGSTCSVVVEALSFTASLALDAAEERERQLSAEEHATKPAPPPPTPAPEEPTEPEDTHAGTSLHAELGAAVVVAHVLAPEVSLGGALVVRVVAEPDETLSPAIGIALTYAGSELGDASREASVRWLAAIVTACPVRWRLGSALGVRPCALGTAGQVEATGENLQTPQTVQRAWWSAGGALRLDVRLGNGVALEVEGGITAPLVERRFVAQPSGRTLAESPRISPVGSAGLVYVF